MVGSDDHCEELPRTGTTLLNNLFCIMHCLKYTFHWKMRLYLIFEAKQGLLGDKLVKFPVQIYQFYCSIHICACKAKG